MNGNINILDYAMGSEALDYTGRFMKTVVNGLTYIFERNASNQVRFAGVTNDKKFYGFYPYDIYGESFDDDVKGFVEAGRKKYYEAINKITAENLLPMDRKQQEQLDKRISDIPEDSITEAAKRRIFKITLPDKQINYSSYNDAFLEYLSKGETEAVLDEMAEKLIRSNAVSLNYNVILESMAEIKAIELLQDENIAKRVKLVNILRENSSKTVRLTLDVDGTKIDDAVVDREDMIRALIYRRDGEIDEWNFVPNIRGKIRKAWAEREWCMHYIYINDIIKVTYGRKVLYEG